MNRSFRNLTVSLTLCLLPLAGETVMASTPSKGWEPVRSEQVNARPVVKETEIEIKSAPSTIIIATNRSIQVKVFTILGRLVSNETVQAGTSKFTLPVHGVYIVKVGDLTCKVAV